jgi:hypothetical protein
MEFEIPERFKEGVKEFMERGGLIRRGRRLPYVLFGYDSDELDGQRRRVKIPTVFALDCSGTAGQKAILEQHAIDFGYQILGYWFPEGKEPEVPIGAIAVPRLGNVDSFTEMRKAIQMLVNGRRVTEVDARNRQLEEDNAVMRAKVAEFEKAQQAEAKSQKPAGKNG